MMKSFSKGFMSSDRYNKLDGHPNLRGFTLVELMITAGILTIVLSGLLATFVSCILMNESNNNLVIAVNDAQYVLEEIKGLAYEDINNFINNFNQFQFIILHDERITFPDPDIGTRIAEVTVNVRWTERGRVRNFSLPTRIARTTQ